MQWRDTGHDVAVLRACVVRCDHKGERFMATAEDHYRAASGMAGRVGAWPFLSGLEHRPKACSSR